MTPDVSRSEAALDGPRVAAVMAGIGIPLVLLVVFAADSVVVDTALFVPAVVIGGLIAWVFATRPVAGGRAAALIWTQMGLATMAIAGTGWSQSPLVSLIPLLMLFAALTQQLEWFLATILVTAATSAVASVFDPNAPPDEWAEYTITTAVMVAIGLSINVLTRGRIQRNRLLAEREERFRGLAENAGDGVYLLRLVPEPHFEYVNPALADLLGVSVADVYADPDLPNGLVHEDDRHLRSVSRNGSAEPLDVRLNTADGPRWVSVATQAIRDPAGTVVAVQGVVRDITRRRQTEDALTAALAQQRDAAAERSRIDAMRDGFMRAVTHEVRTPLTAIRGMSELMVERGDRLEPHVLLDLARRIDGNARRLELLLADVLDAARTSTSDDESRPDVDATDLEGLVKDVLSVLDLSDREVDVCMPDEPVVVSTRHVRRILDVFLHNVARHTPAGTPVQVRGTVEDRMLHLAVADRGPGVPAGEHDDVFRAFHQGSHTYEDASPGTGIGLAIVAQYARMLGGHAWVEDRDGGGAVFHATLQAPTQTR